MTAALNQPTDLIARAQALSPRVLAATPPPSYDPDEQRRQRAETVDAMVEANRAATPQTVADQRGLRRLSIRELNELDIESIRARIQSHQTDRRPPLVQVLDLIDLPRNAVANLIFPAARRAARAEGDYAALGLPRVTTADALDTLGMEPGVARGIVGFVGDVALDPLTYLGPAGFGLKATAKGGSQVAVNAAGRRAIKKGLRRAAEGAAAADPVVDRLLRAQVPEAVVDRLNRFRVRAGQPAVTAEERARMAASRLLGERPGGSRAVRIGQRAIETLGGDQVRRGGALAEDLTRLGTRGGERALERTAAARAFVDRYGVAASKGVGWGDRGSGILHIPFTSIGVRTPGFTAAGRTAARNAAIARAGLPAVSAIKSAAVQTQADTIVRVAEQTLRDVDTAGQIAGAGGGPTISRKALYAAVNREFPGILEGTGLESIGLESIGLESIGLAPKKVEKLRATARSGSMTAYLAALDAEARLRTNKIGRLTRVDGRALGVGDEFAIANGRAVVMDADPESLLIQVTEPPQSIPVTGSDIIEVDGDVLTFRVPRSGLIVADEGSIRPMAAEFVANLPAQLADRSAQVSELQMDMAARAVSLIGDLKAGGPIGERQINAALLAGDQVEAARAAAARLDAVRKETIGRAEQLRAIQRANALPDPALEAAAEAAEEVADDLHRGITALLDYRQRVGGAIMEMATPGERAAIEMAKLSLGVADDIIGASGLGEMGRAMGRVFGESAVPATTIHGIDRWWRRVFGQPSGLPKKYLTALQHSVTGGKRQAANEAAGVVIDGLRTIMRDHDIADEHFDGLGAVLLGLMYRERAATDPKARHLMGVLDPGSALHRHLQRVSGSTDILQNEPVMAALTRMAQDNVAFLDDLGEAELAADMLGSLAAGYVPNVATRELRTLARAQADSGVLDQAGRSRGAGPLGASQAFQRARTTDHFMVPVYGEYGEVVDQERLFVFEVNQYGGLSDKDIETIFGTPELQAHARAKRDLVNRLEELPPDLLAAAEPRATDVFTLNEYAAAGGFRSLTGGGDLPRGMFETNAAMVMGARAGQHRAEQGRRAFLEGMAGRHISVHPDEIRGVLQSDQTIRLADGRVARVLPSDRSSDNIARLAIGDRVYRRLDGRIFPSGANPRNNPIAAAIGTQATTAMFEESVAGAIEQAARLYDDLNTDSAVLKSLERATNAWKSVTLLHPSWWTINMVGDAILGTMAGLRPDTIARQGRKWARVLMAGPNSEVARATEFVFNGRTYTGAELYEIMRAQRVTAQDRFAEAAVRFFADGRATFAQPTRAAGIGEAYREAVRTAAQADLIRKIPGADKVAAGAIVMGTGAARMNGLWHRLNGRSADFMRGLTFMSLLENGNDLESAGRAVIRGMYDYQDLTDVERRLRLLIPFYTWVRHSMAHHMRVLLERPAYLNAYGKVQRMIEEALASDERVPDHLRPAWMREQLAIQVGRDPFNRTAIMAGTALPMEATLRALQPVVGMDGAQEFLRFWMESTNPVIRAPLEIGLGQEVFSGRTIGSDDTASDLSVGNVLASQIRPLRELGIGTGAPGALPAAMDRGATSLATRLAVGGRAQDFSAERTNFALLREFRQEVEAIRTAVFRAERDGDLDRSLRARARLVETYQRMIDAGFGDEVPGYGREQAAQARP